MKPRTKHNRLGAVLVGASVMAATLPAAALAADYTMKIGFTTINDPLHYFSQLMEKEIEARSNGRIEVELYPSAQLGTAGRQIEGLQFGTQEVFVSPPGFFAGINGGMQALDAPGAFHSMDHAQAVMSDPEIYKIYFDLLEPAGILTLTQWVYGPTAVATVEPVTGLDDLKGLKVRVLASPLEQELAKELGMTGVSMDFTEALPALQNGTIDGVRTAMSVMSGMKFYDTARYVLKEETGMIFAGAYVSKQWLDKLPEDLRTLVIDTVRDLQDDGTEIGKESAAKADQQWRDAGVTVVELTKEERRALFDRVFPIGEKFLADGKQTGPVFAVIKDALARHPAE